MLSALDSIYAFDILNIKGTGGRNGNVYEVRKLDKRACLCKIKRQR